jgi:hypothetical protein
VRLLRQEICEATGAIVLMCRRAMDCSFVRQNTEAPTAIRKEQMLEYSIIKRAGYTSR